MVETNVVETNLVVVDIRIDEVVVVGRVEISVVSAGCGDEAGGEALAAIVVSKLDVVGPRVGASVARGGGYERRNLKNKNVENQKRHTEAPQE